MPRQGATREGAIATGNQRGLRLPWRGPPPSLGYIVGAGLIVLLGFAVAYAFVEPPPPSELTIAAGPRGGGYHAFAERYREILAREGVVLTVVETAGSVENLQRLREGSADVALIQGGIADPAEPELHALAGLFYEPLWLFYRGTEDLLLLLYRGQHDLQLLPRLSGKRIAVGPEGSGTRALAERLLQANGVARNSLEFVPLAGDEAAQALLEDRVDAVLMVASVSAPAVRRLLAAPDIRLMSFPRAAGYAQQFPSLSVVTLHAGALDLARHRPADDVRLIAPVANLAAGPSLHPALVALLLQAAVEVHKPGDFFAQAGTFPAAAHLSLPLHSEARRFFDRGPPFLQRYLPFWIASFIERMVILLIPLVTLAIPLIRILPPIYQWRSRSRINRWYRDLALIELARAQGRTDAAAAAAEVDRIEAEVARQRVPLGYANELYALRLHIDYIRSRLRA